MIKQKFRYWSDINPHIITEVHTLYLQKTNVWAGILREIIIDFRIIHKAENQRDVDETLTFVNI